MNEEIIMATKETLRDIFDNARAAGKSRDATVVEMVQAGGTLNTAANLYKEWAKEVGILNVRTGHKAEAFEFITEGDYDLMDDEVRAALKKELINKFSVSSGTAGDYIKGYAAEAGVELPKSQFGGSQADQDEIYEWIKDHPDCKSDEFKDFMRSKMNRSQGSIDETYRGIKMARKLFKDGVKFA